MLAAIFKKAGCADFGSQLFQVTVIRGFGAEDYWDGISEFGIGFQELLANATPEKRDKVRVDVVGTLKEMFPNGSVSLGGEAVIGAGMKP